MTYLSRKNVRKVEVAAGVSFVTLLLVVGTTLPFQAQASSLTDILNAIKDGSSSNIDIASDYTQAGNLQTFNFLTPALNVDPTVGLGDSDVRIVDDSALKAEEGPSGTIADVTKSQNTKITVYIVREGDTIDSIALIYGLKANTLLWANNLPRHTKLYAGQRIIILPIDGISYKVKAGDTLASIAKHTGGSADEIAAFNGLENNSLIVGAEITIPNVEGQTTNISGNSSFARRGITEPAHNVGPEGTVSELAYYIAPLEHYIRTQGLHGYNAVDLAAQEGTPILAAAAGSVVVAKNGGWNGGYGNYVVIIHPNGSETLYAHAANIIVSDGERVDQGQVIAYVGRTGKATGAHVHFEIRNGIRNPF